MSGRNKTKKKKRELLKRLHLEANLRETNLEWDKALKLYEVVAIKAPNWFEARNRLGLLHLKLARFAAAEKHLRATVKLATNAADEAIALNDLAQLLKATNRLAEAEPLMRRALAIDELSNGAEHPSVATCLNNLAMLLQTTNRLAEAEPLMRRALAIDEQSYGTEHPDVARDHNNLAGLLKATNRLVEAEPLFRRALTINEQSYGAEHPKIAIALNNLAQMLQATNRLAEAEPLMRRALAIDEQSYGTEHPDVARDLNNLAGLLQATNRLVEAEPLFRRALAIDEQSYGAEHPRVAIDLNNLALLLQATNRLTEAEPLMRRTLIIDEQSYGAEHPDVARDLNNLAGLLQATNRLAMAEPLMRRCIEIFHTFGHRAGHEHPGMQTVFTGYRFILQALELPPNEIDQKVKDARATVGSLKPFVPEVERLLGPSNPVGDVLGALDRQYKAEDKPPIYFLRPNQPIAPNLDELLRPNPASLNAAGVRAYVNRAFADAIVLYEESLRLREDHPDNGQTAFMIRMGRALALRELGEVKPARDEIRRLLLALNEDENSSALAKGRSRYNLALCEWRLGDRDAAQHEAEESLKGYGKAPSGLFGFISPPANEAEIAPLRTQTKQLLADLKANKPLPPLAKVDAVAALENARVRYRARAALATLPLNQSAVPLLDQVLGPAKSPQEVFETLDRQYREQNKSAIWFLPLSQPIAPHLDELLGPLPANK